MDYIDTLTNLGGHFVGGDLTVVPPVPDVNGHVVLRSDRNYVLQVGRKCLQHRSNGCIRHVLRSEVMWFVFKRKHYIISAVQVVEI